jgi:hypothetical protein
LSSVCIQGQVDKRVEVISNEHPDDIGIEKHPSVLWARDWSSGWQDEVKAIQGGIASLGHELHVHADHRPVFFPEAKYYRGPDTRTWLDASFPIDLNCTREERPGTAVLVRVPFGPVPDAIVPAPLVSPYPMTVFYRHRVRLQKSMMFDPTDLNLVGGKFPGLAWRLGHPYMTAKNATTNGGRIWFPVGGSSDVPSYGKYFPAGSMPRLTPEACFIGGSMYDHWKRPTDSGLPIGIGQYTPLHPWIGSEYVVPYSIPLPYDVDLDIEGQVTMNSIVGADEHGNGAGVQDGIFRSWIWADGKLIHFFEDTAMLYRHHPYIGVYELWFRYKIGGIVAPCKEHRVLIGPYVCATERIGPLQHEPISFPPTEPEPAMRIVLDGKRYLLTEDTMPDDLRFTLSGKDYDLIEDATATGDLAMTVAGVTYRVQEVVPPPVDCEMSEWSEWLPTSEWSVCVNGEQSRSEQRTRTIITPASNGGVACGATVETRAATQACVPATLNPVIVGAAVNTWTRLPDGPAHTVYQTQLNGSPPTSVTLYQMQRTIPLGRGYGCFVINDQGQIFFFGGGHSGLVCNQVCMMDYVPDYGLQVPGGVGPAYPTDTGRPWWEHQGPRAAWDKRLGKYMLMQPSGTWLYPWERIVENHAAYTDANGVVHPANNPVWSASNYLNSPLVFCDDLDAMLFFNRGTGVVWRFNYDTNSWSILHNLKTGGANYAHPGGDSRGGGAACYDPTRKRVYFFGNQTNFPAVTDNTTPLNPKLWYLDIETNVSGQIDMTGGPSGAIRYTAVNGLQGVFPGGMCYDPDHDDVLVPGKSTDDKLIIWRLRYVGGVSTWDVLPEFGVAQITEGSPFETARKVPAAGAGAIHSNWFGLLQHDVTHHCLILSLRHGGGEGKGTEQYLGFKNFEVYALKRAA